MSVLPIGERTQNPGNFPAIQPMVAREFIDLREAGMDVHLDDVVSPEALDPARQVQMDQTIADLENVAEVDRDVAHARFADIEARPAMNAWDGHRMRAIALHPLYNASSLTTLGEGIDPGVFDRPILTGGITPREQLLAAKIAKYGPESGEKGANGIIDSYQGFLTTPIDEPTREMFAGCYDGRAVNTRAISAFNLATDHIEAAGGRRDDIRVASLACGAAGRVYDFVENLENRGQTVERIHMVDKDSMALACAHGLADSNPELQSKLAILDADLTNPAFLDSIEPQSVDVVDLLGLFEYFPSNRKEAAAFFGININDTESLPIEGEYNFAAQLLDRVRQVVRPGGQIIFGNMLNERPQQRYFLDVVQWPRLYQRSMTEVLGIIQDAGYSVEQTEVRIPANEGVYGVYAITLPEEAPEAAPTPDSRHLELVG